MSEADQSQPRHPLQPHMDDPELARIMAAMENLSEGSTAILVNDLRIKVLEGWDPPPEAMLIIVNNIRRGRRAAAAKSGAVAAKRQKARIQSQVPVTTENLQKILDQDLC